jgi:hypothetical protein
MPAWLMIFCGGRETDQGATRPMATKKKSTSTPSTPSTTASGKIIVTEDAIVISLSPAEKRKAQRCLARTGKITFSVKEHSITKLPQILENGKLID